MSKFKLSAEVREGRGKEKAKKLRAAGTYPAIVYGADGDAISLTLNTRETELVLQRIHGEKVLVDLSYGSAQDLVFVRSVQRDPVSEKLIHVDFYRVDPAKEIDTRVPLISKGMPEGVKLGGMLEHGIREVEVRGLPGNIPGHIDVDVSALGTGKSLHVSDLPVIEGLKYLTGGQVVTFHVAGKVTE